MSDYKNAIKLFEAKNYKEAEKLFYNSLFTEDGSNAWCQYYLGCIYFISKDYSPMHEKWIIFINSDYFLKKKECAVYVLNCLNKSGYKGSEIAIKAEKLIKSLDVETKIVDNTNKADEGKEDIINETVERMMKQLKTDPKNIPVILSNFKEKGSELAQLVLNQNQKVLVESSKLYTSFFDHKEENQAEIGKLDSLIEQVEKLQGGSSSNTGGLDGPSTDYLNTTFGEFDKKVNELTSQIKKCETKIEAEKTTLALNNDKIKDTKEYLSKFGMEKKLYLDKVDEELMIDKSKFFYIFILNLI